MLGSKIFSFFVDYSLTYVNIHFKNKELLEMEFSVCGGPPWQHIFFPPQRNPRAWDRRLKTKFQAACVSLMKSVSCHTVPIYIIHKADRNIRVIWDLERRNFAALNIGNDLLPFFFSASGWEKGMIPV